MQERIEQELQSLPAQFVAITLLPTRDHDEIVTTLLRVLGKRCGSSKACYITAAKPPATLRELFALNGVDAKQITFVDCVTVERKAMQDSPDVRYVTSPHDLTRLSIQLNRVFTEHPCMVILDSLNALLLYNNRREVQRFIHTFATLCRKNGFTGVILALREDSDAQLISEIEQFCDSTIVLE